MATALPPGFRFHPTDVELICYYLKRKIMGKNFQFEAISEVELYKFAPWDLPEKSRLRTKDREWHFFCTRDKKYPKGSRTNRSSDIGYWKPTGKDRIITHSSRTVGTKKTLIFHIGKPPKGDRTDWVMYEYKMDDKKLVDAGISQDTYVLCKIFQKSGPGPKIGEQYGAPFSEEDWDDDPAECSFNIPHLSSPRPTIIEPESIHPPCERPISCVNYDDCTDLDGMLLADLEVLDAPLFKNNLTQTSNYVQIDNADALYSEFNELTASEMIISGSNNQHTLCNEYPLLPMLSELDNGQYVELNDLFFTGELVPFHSDLDNGNLTSHQDLRYSGDPDPRKLDDQSHFTSNSVTTDIMCDSLDAEFPFTSEHYALQPDYYDGFML